MAQFNRVGLHDGGNGAMRDLKPVESSENHLLTPKTHSRNDSSYSRNYSLLDIYGTESPFDENMLSEEERPSEIPFAFGEEEPQKSKDQSRIHQSLPAQKAPEKEVKIRLGDSSHIAPLADIPGLLRSGLDRYGFKKASNRNQITAEDYNKWFVDYSQYSLRRTKKWVVLMKSTGLGGELSSPTRFPPKSDKVKKLVRRGIPAEWRGAAWWFYAGGNEKLSRHRGVYEQIVRDTVNLQNKDTEVIERDLNRTFPDNIYFNREVNPPEVNLAKNPVKADSRPDSSSSSNTGTSGHTLGAASLAGGVSFGVGSVSGPSGSTLVDPYNIETDAETPMIQSLRRVLVSFAHYQPQIGYCQSLNFLAGLLLLFMNEEKAFWMLVILTERIIPNVHSADLEGVHTDQGVLMLCIKEYIPNLWAILGRTFEGETLSEDKILTRLPPVTLVTSSWFMSLFVGALPIETVLRVWDIIWYEGSKTIFRISLTICKMCLDNPEFQNKRSGGAAAEVDQIELFQFMQNFPKLILDPNFLIENCFRKIGGYGFGSVSQDEINKCREFVSKQRTKLKKQPGFTTELTDEERLALGGNGEYIHDVYGFHRSIMSGVVWNKNISSKMKKKFTKPVLQ